MIRILSRIARATLVRDAVAMSKAALGITSPSLEFLDVKDRADALSMLGLDGCTAHQISLDGLRALRSMLEDECDDW
jgi:hypothetical protein